MKYLLQACNDKGERFLGLCTAGFLPTMKFQLSQLPQIVGSGRVTTRRAFFYAPCKRVFNLFAILSST